MKGEPVFPTKRRYSYVAGSDNEKFSGVETKWGLTKRELFAAMAMQGLLSAIYSDKKMLDEFTKDGMVYRNGRDAVSENAVSYADALITELEKK